MIAVEELAAVPMLAGVAPDELARLATASGDMRLAPGDYAVHEGGERALFVVLAAGNPEVLTRVPSSAWPPPSAKAAMAIAFVHQFLAQEGQRP